MRIAICLVAAGALLLSGCDSQSSQAPSPVRTTLTNIGQAVQSPQAQAAGDSVTQALTTIGTATSSAVDPVKDSLTSLGESVQSGTEVVSDALSGVGQTVIDATSSSSGPAQQAQQ